MATASNVYDQVLYLNRPYAQTHPERLHLLAHLHGLHPPPVEQARVLELGASEGGNSIPIAVSLPEARITAIELAAVPVERGNRVIRDLGIGNVRLLQMNILDVTPEFGEFDYIVAHGVYSWTPPHVRDKMLGIIGTNLAKNGVAFVSYNTYPCGYLRRILRDMMHFRMQGIADPLAHLERAKEILRLIVDGRPDANAFDRAVAKEAQDILDRGDSAIYHDYLSEAYDPVYFRDFVAHAASHELGYVADANTLDTWNPRLSPQAMEKAAEFAAGDRICREQYLDLLRLCSFRQSLLCHADQCASENGFTEEWAEDRAIGLYMASSARETGEGKFAGPTGANVTTSHAGVIGLLRRLSTLWPRAERIATAAAAELALALFRRGMLELRILPGRAVRAGDRPSTEPLARYQARRGDPQVITLDHHTIAIEDENARKFLQLLDGTRDRAAIAQAMDCDIAEVDVQLDRLSRYAMLLS